MMTRRLFSSIAISGLVPDLAFAQHAAVQGDAPPGTVWLNANENPDGPPPACQEAIARAISDCGRYNHRIFPALHAAIARSVGLDSNQIIPGAGSTEVLHCALDAFTSPARPLITVWPTWEMATEVARASGKPVVKVPLLADSSADVERLAAEARKTGGGVIHLGNPNNPTSSITAKAQLRWLARHLPANTVLLMDEAYIQFADPELVESGVAFVREGRNVIATRTFSKLYGAPLLFRQASSSKAWNLPCQGIPQVQNRPTTPTPAKRPPRAWRASSRKQRYLLRVFGDYDSSMKSSGWRSLTKRIFLPVESEFSFVDMGGIFPDERGNAVPAMAHFV